jgi:hypothetical protein
VATDQLAAEGLSAYTAFWDAIHDEAALDKLRAERPHLWEQYGHTLEGLPEPSEDIPLCVLARFGLHALTRDLEWTYAFESNERLGHPFPTWFGQNRQELERRCPEIVGAPL